MAAFKVVAGRGDGTVLFRLEEAGLGELLVGDVADKLVRVVEVVLVVVVVDLEASVEVPLSLGFAAAGAVVGGLTGALNLEKIV